MRKNMCLVLAFLSVLAFLQGCASAAYKSSEGDNGLITFKSMHSVEETTQKLLTLLDKMGLKVFTQISHDEGAKSVGMELRPTRLIIFGNPKVGTPLMQCSQTTGIDLPQKVLVWQDANGDNWVSYNNPDYLDARHGLDECTEVLGKVKKALGNLKQVAN